MRIIGLYLIGLLFGAAAAYFYIIGFSISTAVPNAAAPAGFDGIANLQLMHIQLLDILIGTGAAIVSAVFLAGGAIVSVIAEAHEARAKQ
jgi:hypothetical protein